MKKYGLLAGFYLGLMIIFLSIGDIFMHLGDPNYHGGKPVALIVVGLLIGSTSMIGFRYRKAAEKQENPMSTGVQALAAYADYTKATSAPPGQSNQDPEQSNHNEQGGVNNG